jgi:hypothetical protein
MCFAVMNLVSYIIIYVAEIAQSVLRRTMGWTAGIWFLARTRLFSPLYSVQSRSGAHPPSYPIDIGAPSPEARS